MGRRIVVVLGVVLGACGFAWGQNHRLSSNQVVVNTQNHWSHWDFVQGTLDIAPSSEIRPAFVPKGNNAVTDILEHLLRSAEKPEDTTILDAIDAGSNREDIPNLFDGDETTYWEPDPDSPVRDWWFQVDMGRLINATRIGLKFVPEGQGDPFLQFVVLTADNANKGAQIAGIVPTVQVYRTPSENKSQRSFAVDLDGRELIDMVPGRDFEGDMVRFVQVVVTESNGLRGTEISVDEYEELVGADRGDVVYHKKVGDGEVEVEREIYEAIDSQSRGTVRYYRRERPRLAELEVYELGRNIAQGLVADRKGSAESSNEGSVGNLMDGEGTYLTFNLTAFATSGVKFGERFLEFDLGAAYWLDTVQMWYNLFAAGGRLSHASFNIYEIQTSDGTPAPGGGLMWTAPEQERGIGRDTETNRFQPTPARFVRVAYPFTDRSRRNEGTKARIREVQLYGEGHHPELELVSGLIPLGSAKNLVSIEWEADTPPATSVLIQTRTGNEVADDYLYYDSGGTEVSAGKYDKLGFFKKGRIDTVQVAGADWSNWSVPYVLSGDPITSPSPREFLMLRVRLATEDPMSAASLRSIHLNFNPPVAQQLQGELDPAVVEQLGTEQELKLYIKPIFATEDLGFDEILVRTPPDMELEFTSLRMGTLAQWENGEVAALGGVQVVETRADSLWLRLDQLVQRRSQAELIEVGFITALFSPGVVLPVALGNSSLENSWQRVDPGDATELAQSQGLQILASTRDNEVLGQVAISPPVVTPNGDGINDAMTFAFAVRRLSGERPVEVRIFDLAGRQVKKLDALRPVVAGDYAITWAADDENGRVVPPGIYLLRIDVAVDSDSEVKRTGVQRLLHVAY